MDLSTFCEVLSDKKIKGFSPNGDREFALIKNFEECLAWQLKFTPYFNKDVCKELAKLNWQRIQESETKLKDMQNQT